MKKLVQLLLAMLIAFVLDWLTKAWAEQTLELYQPVPVIGDIFRFTLGYNSGVAFGLFANGGSWPLIITGLVIFGLLIWFVRALLLRQLPAVAVWPIGLLLGGAIANFSDRFSDGRVTDFLDFGIGATRWPTFNLADSFILIGLGLLLLITGFAGHDVVKDADQPGTP
jgi:signal peptidase II